MNSHRDPDRRREERLTATGMRALLRPGYGLIVVDLSARGALVEAARALRPGSQVEVHLENDARREVVEARVMRCTVVAINCESGITYRAALAFNDACDWVREERTLSGYAIPDGATADLTRTSANGHVLPAAGDEGPPAQTRVIK
jgi:hypothetical protein